MEQAKKLTAKEALAKYPFFKIPKNKTRYSGDNLSGRPYSMAVNIPIDPWEIDELEIEYYEIMRQLTYREAMALMRALGLTYSTFLARKYGHRPPQLKEVIATVNWVRNGKPIELIKHKLPFASLLYGA